MVSGKLRYEITHVPAAIREREAARGGRDSEATRFPDTVWDQTDRVIISG
jgi:hypothetical protein